MAEREFDIVLYGATGFTGRLVAEHLVKTYGVGRDLHWAIAGRSEAKLKEIRDLIGAPASLPLVKADASDLASLTTMAEKAKVIISTVGPYQLYGDALVAACAKAGTDYVDLTGESNWIAKMIGAYEKEAKKPPARGSYFPAASTPFPSIAACFSRRNRRRRNSAATRRACVGGCARCRAAFPAARSPAAWPRKWRRRKDPSIGKLMTNPFALTPGFEGPAQPDLNTPYEDKVTGAWVGPFMMSAINTKAVHRANFLLGHPWGEDFLYDEMTMLAGPPSAAPAPGFNFGGGAMPKPGEGPSKEDRESGFYDVLMIAEYPDGRTLRCAVKGDKDPGYGSTSRMLGESAVCLLRDVPRTKTAGGCWTSAAAMGEALIKRLEAHAGVKFVVEP